MDTDEIQRSILIELRMIRRTVRGILFVMVSGVVLILLVAMNPHLASEALVLCGIIAVLAVLGAVLGIGSARMINCIRKR